MSRKKTIIIQDYCESWKDDFQGLRSKIYPVIKDYIISIEHVGSTSVPGLAAKPIIDMDIIIKSYDIFESVKNELESLGYYYCGDQGVPMREAFNHDTPLIAHHLYVCIDGCTSLKNHILLRDHLINNPKDRDRYAELKRQLAAKYSDDIESYVEGKTDFIVSILEKYGIQKKDLF